MEIIKKVLTYLIVFSVNSGLMLIILGLMGLHKAVANNVNPSNVSVDTYGMFSISVVLLCGGGVLWLLRFITTR